MSINKDEFARLKRLSPRQLAELLQKTHKQLSDVAACSQAVRQAKLPVAVLPLVLQALRHLKQSDELLGAASTLMQIEANREEVEA